MPTFDTPTTITVTLDITVGNALITASDRTDTVVEVRPTDSSRERDVKVAEQAKVDYANGRLTVTTPRGTWWLSTMPGMVDVLIELPTGSDVHATTGMGAFRSAGRLGECRFKSGTGHIVLEDTADARIRTGTGRVTLGRAAGRVDIRAGGGEVRVRAIGGSGVIKNAGGDTRIGEASGDLRVNSASGDIVLDRAHGAVTAKTHSGSIRVGEVVRDEVVLHTYAGDVEVGIREGTAAWLDVNAMAGNLRNELGAADGPGKAEETVKVRARTYTGDVIIRRSLIGDTE